MSVAVGRQYFEDAVLELQDRYVEGSAAEIVNRDDSFFTLVDSVSKRRRGGLIHDAQDLEACEVSGVFCRLPLSIIEVSRNRDDCLRDFFAKELRSTPLEIAKYEC